MNWVEIGLIVLIVGLIVYGVRQYFFPAPWDDED